MPVTFRIDKTQKVIHTKCIGEVTFKEVLDHFEALERDPECRDSLSVLLDATEMTSIPESGHFRTTSHELGRIRDRVRFDACAIVVSTDVFLGMAHVFKAYTSEHFRITRVFRTLDEAEAWLVSQQSPPPNTTRKRTSRKATRR